MFRRTAVSIGAIALVLALAACAAQGEQPADRLALDGSKWVLTTLNGISVAEGSNLTLRFAAGWAAGFAGINRYSGEYAADGGTLTIGEIEVTAQLCQTPQSAMPQEDAFIEALQNAAAYRVMGDHLEIDNAEGETTLVFTRREEFSMGSNDLVGTDSTADR
jgi:heat shock protein HslJ